MSSASRRRRLSTLAPWQIWWVDFDPQVGREQAGLRPAIVVSSQLHCDIPNYQVVVIPCSTRDRGWVLQPSIELDGRSGVALCDQVRTISTEQLKSRHNAMLTPEKIEEIRYVLQQVIDL